MINDTDRIRRLRERHPYGLHFVVGDTHGQRETVKKLLDRIAFDPQRDHVYFVGDYNAGYHPYDLVKYLSVHYQPDLTQPGFHLLRGNHERWLNPTVPLNNLPDIFVIRSLGMKYVIAHAGMVQSVFDLLMTDDDAGDCAYQLDDEASDQHGPFNQIVWSGYGLYSRQSWNSVWPTEESLLNNKACIIHGHTPFAFLVKDGQTNYGDNGLYLKENHILFSESLQSFNIDSNIKGRDAGDSAYRGLSCVCLEVLDEAAAAYGGHLTANGVRYADGLAFTEDLARYSELYPDGDVQIIRNAKPKMTRIITDRDGNAVFDRKLPLTANEYQALAMRTLNPALDKKDVLINSVMGLCGESGEVIDIVKKWLAQGHGLDKDKLAKELGDVAWYLAEAATALDLSLEEILRGNIEKLKARYPDGFESERSLWRKENEF